ncbi:unnamed protein product [Darwinula stevensoni]|uniref:Multifunctional fusion protein n=1 Tax=Darwinula stevensoni TaxID=69355 RepID=A0A7R8XDL7_9CRUS|nr:unnamed protein product [Darwinula stevensoni]CAG0894908.1 unnamed protein product [Darwinula stevensoni]
MRYSTERKVRRRPAPPTLASESIDEYRHTPEDWEPMENDIYRMVTLSSTSEEYKNIIHLFQATKINIKKVSRIQNAYIWQVYQDRRLHLLKTDFKDDASKLNEKFLFHGTATSNIQFICKQNFDWRLHRTANGSAYGKGVYFATDPEVSMGYTAEGNCMFVAKVLIGLSTPGNSTMTWPPSGYHSTSGPRMIIKYHDQDFYPAYLIEAFAGYSSQSVNEGLLFFKSPSSSTSDLHDFGHEHMPSLDQDADVIAHSLFSNSTNFTDMGAIWRWVYESDTFEEEVAELWETVRPLYEQLHAYVRRKLREKYGEDKVTADGPIPAHLLGDMWAQDWSNLKDLLQPYKMEASLDITPALREQNYTAERLFRLSEEFFTSIGLSPMPETFWNLSIIEKPKDRTIICHASAWDFCDSKDFRIKQCTDMTMEDFVTVHHEMGHVEYFIQYKDLHIAFRDGANPGFHEAVGDVIALSVMTPKHMVKIGLLSESAGKRNWQVDLNYLMSQALSSVAFLPYGYLIDVWRWNVFRGNISSSHYNCEWWKLRSELQGIQPPNIRSEEDFDPGAKYHIAANVPYIRYFVSNIIQFQFHRALCTAAGEYDPKNPGENPIHQCDIYQSKEAGNLLKAMLRLGSSRPWGEAMAAITGGNPKMDASALREYFQPLEDWLTEDNKKHGAFVGWKPGMDLSHLVCMLMRCHGFVFE